jgi:hypothetical protein
MADTPPTDTQIKNARDVLARAALAEAGDDAPRAAMIELISMKEFGKVDEAARAAQRLNPADVELSYAISMLDRIRARYTTV